jgi:hypothetical protein
LKVMFDGWKKNFKEEKKRKEKNDKATKALN